MDLSKEEKQDKELICKICNDIFTTPKILECMHTFCQSCIESRFDAESNAVICPVCSRPTKVFNGVSSLTTNFILQNVIDALNEISRTSEGILICGECEQDVATSFCCDCFIKFCASCTTHHLRSKQSKGHAVFEIDQVSRKALYQGRVKKCETHNIVLRYFCEDCQISTCHDCTIGNLHNNHTYFLLDDIVLQNKNELHDYLEKIHEKKRLISKAISHSENVLEKIRVEKETSIEIINHTFAKIQKALNEKKEKAIKNIEDSFEKNKVCLDRVKYDVIILDEWAKFTEKVLDNRSHSDIMENYFNLRNQLLKVADVTLIKKNSVAEKPPASPIPTNDGPRKLNRNPNAKTKPRLSKRHRRAKSMENISVIEKVETPKTKQRRSVHFAPDDLHLHASKSLNNRAKSDDSLLQAKSKLRLQYSQPYSTETSTFSQNKETKRKAPPRPIPPRISSIKSNKISPPSTPPVPPQRSIDSQQQYVVSVTPKPKHPKRLPPPPPRTPTPIDTPDTVISSTAQNDAENQINGDNNKVMTSSDTPEANQSVSDNPKILQRSSSNPPEKPVRRRSLTPEPRPRFLAGIKMVNQKISVNNVILNLLIESLGESFKLGRKETGPFYVEAAYGDVLFEVSEEIVCQ